jgi:putative restriction endonuclease
LIEGFVKITLDFKIKLSNYSNDNAILYFFVKFENKKINLPDRFLPSKEFLDWHYNNLFKK